MTKIAYTTFPAKDNKEEGEMKPLLVEEMDDSKKRRTFLPSGMTRMLLYAVLAVVSVLVVLMIFDVIDLDDVIPFLDSGDSSDDSRSASSDSSSDSSSSSSSGDAPYAAADSLFGDTLYAGP
jgi:cytoskeletal protein RodZ